MLQSHFLTADGGDSGSPLGSAGVTRRSGTSAARPEQPHMALCVCVCVGGLFSSQPPPGLAEDGASRWPKAAVTPYKNC